LATQLYLKARRAIRRYLQHNLPECSEITRVISQSLDRKLTFGERVTLKLHLMVCLRCVRYLQQLVMLRNVTRHPSQLNAIEESAPPLTNEARERIKAALKP
jgi:hypothetical protein